MAFLDILKKKKDERALLAQRFRDDLALRFPGATMTELAPMQFRLEGNGVMESTISLENLHRQLDGLDYDAREEEISRYFAVLIRPAEGEDEPVSRRQIVPVIKDQLYFDEMKATMVREHLAADLWILYMIDQPTSMMALTPAQRDKLDLTSEELRTLSIDNIRLLLPPVEKHGDGEWFLVTAGGAYTASVLLLDEIWDELADQVEGDLVAAAPARDVLLVTGSSSAAGIASIRAKAIEIEQGGSYVISSTLLRRKDSRWVAFS